MWQRTSEKIFTGSIQAKNGDDNERCGDKPLDSCLADCFRGSTQGWRHINGGNTVDVAGGTKSRGGREEQHRVWKLFHSAKRAGTTGIYGASGGGSEGLGEVVRLEGAGILVVPIRPRDGGVGFGQPRTKLCFVEG
jgi:hypothetical protein